MVFQKKVKDPVVVAKEEAARARELLELAERRQAELEARSAVTPVVVAGGPAEQSRKLVDIEPPVPPPPLSVEEQRVVDELKEWGRLYDGLFPELGPSGHASAVRGLLFAIFCELRRKD